VLEKEARPEVRHVFEQMRNALYEGRPADALPQLPSVTVTEAGLNRATHGNPIGPEHLTARWIPPAASGRVRVLGPAGRLVALAESRGGALHPVVVLG